tara:strand:+ start:3118 stop:3894 length:777 start_codon:yes stop_codon:yes gene_type:complete
MEVTFVSKKDYKNWLKTDIYHDMHQASIKFTKKNNNKKRLYNLFWVKNSFNHFTRKFEYQYIFENVKNLNLNILDAGCGISFFPDYLIDNKNNLNLTLLDNANNVMKFYQKNKKFIFIFDSLTDLKKLENRYDLIYSISTIEHIPNYYKVIDEIYDKLKINGDFLLTFDISYSKLDPINIYNVNNFLKYIGIKFEKEYVDLETDYELLFNSHDLNKKDLPWFFPTLFYRVYYSLKNKKIDYWPPKITVAMLKVKKIEV